MDIGPVDIGQVDTVVKFRAVDTDWEYGRRTVDTNSESGLSTLDTD